MPKASGPVSVCVWIRWQDLFMMHRSISLSYRWIIWTGRQVIYVIVPYAKYQPIEIAGLSNVIYVDALPDAYTMGEDAMQKEAENKAKKADDLAGDAKVLALGDLVAYLEKRISKML